MLPLDLERLSSLVSLRLILGFLCIGLINGVFMLLVSYKFLQIMQQCGYKGKEYLKWLNRKDNVYLTRLTMLSILSVLGFMLINMALSFIDVPMVKYSGFAVYIFFLLYYLRGELKRKDKVPLVITKRIIRLIFTFVLVTMLTSFILIMLVNLIAIPFRESLLAEFRYAILCFCPILTPHLVYLAYLVNSPIEKTIINRYLKASKEKLSGYKSMIKIGITGSYGKTSVKEILKTILSERYKVVATPESYNTPLGISKTVKRLDGTEEVFIAEMGARHVGDIKELTQLVSPDYAIITGVTCQHLETFAFLENIKKAKYEIVEHMKSGKAVFSADNEHTLEMSKNCKLPCRLAGISKKSKPYVYADGIVTGTNGTTFTLHVGSESSKCTMGLLGKHNVSNVCLAVAIADYLNLSIGEICAGISKIKPIKHRLQLLDSQNGIFVIDDSYNSNPEGVKTAIEVIKEFSGKKFVVTPGIVELGTSEGIENYKFGTLLSGAVDKVILIGRARTLKIREGLLEGGFKPENIIMVNTLDDAKSEISKLAKQGDVVLFENDLPDKYL